MVSSASHSSGITLAERAAANTTNANSPPCASRNANSQRWRGVTPSVRATNHSAGILSPRSTARRRATMPGRLASSPKSMVMPTDMKKRPRSRPLNGSISLSRAWRNSESASSTPARNAPSAIDRPASDISSAMPITSSSANAVNSSRTPSLAITRSAGRVR
jgi:hypothetical protein